MEIVNEVFNALEEHFAILLSQEYHENMLDPEFLNVIQYRKAIVTCVNVKGEYISTFKLHSLVLDKAGHFKVLQAAIAKNAKQIRHVDISFTITVNMLPNIEEREIVVLNQMEIIVPKALSLFEHITALFKVFYAYHRGIIMAKHVQFQCRFIHSLDILCDRVQERIKEHLDSRKYIIGDSIMYAAIISYCGSVPAQKRDALVDSAERCIKRFTDIHQRHQILDKFLLHNGYSKMISTFGIKSSHVIVSNMVHDMIFIDPHYLAQEVIEPFFSKKGIPFRVLDASQSLFSKQIHGPFDANETIYIFGEIWSAQALADVTNLLKEKYGAQKGFIFHNMSLPNRVLLSIPSRSLLPKLDFEVKIVDWSYSAEILSAKLFDILMHFRSPKFHREITELNMFIEVKSMQLDSWYQRILRSSSAETDLDDTQVHDIILFQRETANLEEMIDKKKQDEFENETRYDAYFKYVDYAMTVWDMLKNLKAVVQTVNFSEHSLIEAFRSSLDHFPINEYGNIHISEYRACVDDFIYRLAKHISNFLSGINRICFFLSLSISRWLFFGTLTGNDYHIFKKLLEIGREAIDFKSFCRLSEEFVDRNFKSISSLLELSQGFLNLIHINNFYQESYENNIGKFLAYLVFSPQCFESIINSGILLSNKTSFLDGQSRENHTVFDSVLDTKETLVFIVSDIIQDTLESIVELSDKYSDFFLHHLTDSDKIDDKWIGKLVSSSLNRGWVIIHFDDFWKEQLPRMLQMFLTAKEGFRIWVIVPKYSYHKLPNWILAKFAHCIYDEDRFDTTWMFRKLKFLERSYPNIFHPLLMKFLKFQIILYQETLLGGLSFIDKNYFRLGCETLNRCITEGLNHENTFDVLMDIVYGSEIQSIELLKRIKSCWKEANSIVEARLLATTLPSDNWSHDLFDHYLKGFIDDLFDITKKTSKIQIQAILKDVCSILLQFNFPLSKPRNNYIDSIAKTQLLYYLRTFPSSISARKLHESIGNIRSPLDSFLIGEANNLLNLIRFVVIDLIT